MFWVLHLETRIRRRQYFLLLDFKLWGSISKGICHVGQRVIQHLLSCLSLHESPGFSEEVQSFLWVCRRSLGGGVCSGLGPLEDPKFSQLNRICVGAEISLEAVDFSCVKLLRGVIQMSPDQQSRGSELRANLL